MKKQLGFVLCLLLAGCNGSPSREVAQGEVILRDDFDTAGSWDQAAAAGADVQISGGAFHFEADAGRYIFSVDYRAQTDVVIEVEALHLSDDDSSGFGLMCRANASGDGYYFLIGADGSGTIRRGQGREVTPLVAWTKTNAVVTGGSNRLRAVCTGDMLALYVNGIFVGEAHDSLYSHGYTGLAVVTTRPGQRIAVDFDALRVYDAK